MVTTNGKVNKKSVEDRFSKLELRDQIILRPDTYIGSIEEDTFKRWVYDDVQGMMVYKNCSYVPGLYKIFDEVAVNAKDHTIRDPSCRLIKFNIDEDTGEITCFNDGDEGVPVAIHKVHKIWVPELIFGNLLTSENYDDTELKYVGGKNGFGAKLANIFSTKFYIEVFDSKNGKLYKQTFYDNMSRKDEPIIKNKAGKSSYLKISFIPDFKKFKIKGLNKDTLALFKKRAYDVAACTANTNPSKAVKVYINDELINIRDFKDYINMFYESTDSLKKRIVYEVPNENWKVAAIYDVDNTGGFQHISYVNGICTIEGGTHVNHVISKIIKHIQAAILVKDKNINVTEHQVKENITLFIDALIDKPSFDSQLKEKLTTQSKKFEFKCDLSDEFYKKFAKTGIVENILSFAKLKEQSGLKKISGTKVRNIHIEKLDDAHYAGTKNSVKCTLILTEGDSAKTFAVDGLSIIGKDYYGVFPLKGKPLNVRDMPSARVISNEEIKNIISILGLKIGKKYETKLDLTTLRYGSILIITDQDLDGSHIKGLLINFIEAFWPGLVTNMGYEFIKTLPTPILKAWLKTDTKKKNVRSFYTFSEYNAWKSKVDIKKYEVKYYKGLGTFVASEAKECFRLYDQKLITYTWDDFNKGEPTKEHNRQDDKSFKAIDLAFSETKREERKHWLQNYSEDDIIENDSKYVTFYDFIHKDMKHFSFYDNTRSIPSIYDMFKPSTRKIMYSAFLKKELLKKEIKVSQFSGFVSQVSAYHHGEKSLEGAIINLAQNFLGSNNVNLLRPNGNFGTRLLMGHDHASSRYIYTQLSYITPLIYRSEDECILKYNEDDGKKIEPKYYIPIIPMLVNECQGIGTGFSSTTNPHNINDIINNCKNMINKKPFKPMAPWFRGFKGIVRKVDNFSYETIGQLNILDDSTIRITELPVGMGTTNYMNFINGILYGEDDKKPKKGGSIGAPKKKNVDELPLFESVVENNETDSIDIKITFADGELNKILEKGDEALLKKLKLITKYSSTNMHLHSVDGSIRKYNTVKDIFQEFFNFRLEAYAERKSIYLAVLKEELDIIYWKIKFLEMYLGDKIIINKRTTQNVYDQLEKFGFPKFSAKKGKVDEEEVPEEEVEEQEGGAKNKVKTKLKGNAPSYNYLKMNIFIMTSDNMEKLRQQHDEKSAVYEKYKVTPIEEIWLSELSELERIYPTWLEDDTDNDKQQDAKKNSNTGKKNLKKKLNK